MTVQGAYRVLLFVTVPAAYEDTRLMKTLLSSEYKLAVNNRKVSIETPNSRYQLVCMLHTDTGSKEDIYLL